MYKFIFSLMILLITVVSSFATPDELLFQPGPEVGMDVYVDSWFPDENHDGDYLPVFGTTIRLMWIYIEFVELEPYLGSGYECLSATLSLFWISGNPAPAPWLRVYRAAGTWEEDTITWNNQPGYIGDPCVYEGPYPEGPEWVDIDCVTEFVSGWFSGEYEHHGFVIRMVDENYGYSAQFYPSDNPHDEKPKLYVEYQGISVEPISLGKIRSIYK